MKKQLIIVGIIVLLVFVGLSGCIQEKGKDEKSKFLGLKSASLKVIGESFIGLQFKEELNLTYTELDGFVIQYTCNNTYGYKPHCNCKTLEKHVDNNTVEKFLDAINALKDGGDNAKCCDHPWTEIELIYANGNNKSIVVANEPIDIEIMFSIDC